MAQGIRLDGVAPLSWTDGDGISPECPVHGGNSMPGEIFDLWSGLPGRSLPLGGCVVAFSLEAATCRAGPLP